MTMLRPKDVNTNLFILFILWPAATLFESIRNYRSQWARNGLWMFVIFFGYTFIPREGNDSTRYIAWLEDFHRSGSDFSTFISMLYAEGSRYVDIFQPIVTYIVAIFTDDSRILFAVFGFIFGFFYSRNIWYLLSRTSGSLNIYSKVFILIFALIVPFWFINGVRFWTAAHVFFFGAMMYLFEDKKKGLWIAALSIFVHFSYMFPVLVLLIYRFAGNRTVPYLIFFYISIFISEINIPIISQAMMAVTPDIFHDRIVDYTSDTYIEKISTQGQAVNWYVTWFRRALGISIYILLLAIYVRGREVWLKNSHMLRLFSFLLLFGGVANILSQIPSVGRFVAVWNLFSTSFIFLYFYFSRNDIFIRRLFFLLTPAYALFLIVAIRTGFDNTGVFAFITNPIIAPFLEGKLALIDLIK